MTLIAVLAVILNGRSVAAIEFSSNKSASYPTLKTSAKFVVLADFQTGAVLYEKDGGAEMFPSSMTKIMTAYLLEEQLQQGRMKLDDRVTIGKNLGKNGGKKTYGADGSSMKLNPGNNPTLEELFLGMVVHSGNDAATVIAETVGGSIDNFVAMMNQKSAELGLVGTQFANPTGYPTDKHFTTARDLAILTWRLIHDFPDYYHYFSAREFTYNKIEQQNRNPLLFQSNSGADGVKTGNTERGGHGLVASANRNGRRLILVINGMASKQALGVESSKILDWGYREFDNITLVEAGEVIATAPVWLGKQSNVGLKSELPVMVTVPRNSRADVSAVISYNAPIMAPMAAGVAVARLSVNLPGGQIFSYPIVTAEDVQSANYLMRIGQQVWYQLGEFLRLPAPSKSANDRK
ncbi:MAG: D-alanyl-D-alanine carboxypeptidase [Alphaproteobacteria bacterium]|nr:D-alanyl-D-alanine carboxypeptidase [Alphaproteobacteria bacterium]